MHSLTICFGPTGTVWNLLFKSDETFSAAEAKSKQDPAAEAFLTMTDDFGQNVTIERKHVIAVLREDLDLSQVGQVERGLHNARTQAKANQRGMSDPAIRSAAMMQGPAVLSGGMPNGRFNG